MTSELPETAQNLRWHPCQTRDTLLLTVAHNLVALANTTLSRQSRFDIVLAGGDTPRDLYALLKSAETDWSRWHIWFGDERCLPAGDSGRNDSMAYTTWLSHVRIPPEQIHVLNDVDSYNRLLADVPVFDLVLLGLGEDGHTASLFPGQNPGISCAAPTVLAVCDAPKPPPRRLTLSARRLSAANAVWFLVCGDGKHNALRRWQRGDTIPAKLICPANGVDVFHT
jgi:6-phosphogluconolactonase